MTVSLWLTTLANLTPGEEVHLDTVDVGEGLSEGLGKGGPEGRVGVWKLNLKLPGLDDVAVELAGVTGATGSGVAVGLVNLGVSLKMVSAAGVVTAST